MGNSIFTKVTNMNVRPKGNFTDAAKLHGSVCSPFY